MLKDLPAALVDLNGILAIDAENSYAKSTAAQIDKILNPPPKAVNSKSTSKTKAGTARQTADK